jgi:ribonuclease VapC
MLVVDTSALIACLTDEPEKLEIIDALSTARVRIMTSVNLLEARLVSTFGKGLPEKAIDRFLMNHVIDIVPFDEALSNLAFEAYRRFGKGRHPARLNMGDCAAYALATARGWPLLFKGDDFSQTDVERG